jgi:hypothetical protein
MNANTVNTSMMKISVLEVTESILDKPLQAGHEYIQCIQKLFRLILKLIKYFFPSSLYTQYPILTKQEQVFRISCKKYHKITGASYFH